MISVISSILMTSHLAGQTVDSQTKTTLTIDVKNQTANGTSTENDEVVVTIYQQGKQIDTLKGNVDSQGKAVFENVPTGSDFAALPNVKHKDMMFNGHPVALIPGQTEFNGHVEVFEVSTDKSKLSVVTHHFIIKQQADSLGITEYMRLENSSDMAIISDQKDENNRNKVLEVKLPKGFKNLICLRYFHENALVISKSGFYDTMAIPPGQFDAEFSYSLPIDSEKIDITKTISLPTSDFMVFSLLGKGRVKGLGDSKGQINFADGSAAEYFNLPVIKAGQQVKFQLTGLNVNKSNRQILIALIAVFALMALLAIRRLISQKS
jgi:hypothetical protein